ncbi:hypothetical protein FHG87_014664 [Trinorchestia longiramus]|nr:hypothetical protein FHG87_014664 [Trinorchestia longiramus]
MDNSVPRNTRQVTFSSMIHVVPEVTDTWNMTVNCPCYNIEPYFMVNLTFPPAAHPPWNVTVHIAYNVITPSLEELNGVLVDLDVQDFNTFDNGGPGGASGAVMALDLEYELQPSTAGNYTISANLSNEVSSTLILEEFVVHEGIRNVSAVLTWVIDGVEMPGSGLNGDVYITNMTTLVMPTTVAGE